ncbi:MAG: Abi family protein [Candidatus Delongbacteria bacterium]
MKYEKEPLTFQDQAELLLSRGLIAEKPELVKKLNSVNYYRLSGYFFPFQDKSTDKFYNGTEFSKIWNRYIFDRQLRLLVLDAIERLEVSIKTNSAYHFSHRFGAFGHLDKNNLPKMSDFHHTEWLKKIGEETNRSKDIFVSHFFSKYGDNHKCLPLWMLVEVIPFGSLLNFYKGMEPSLKRQVAQNYKIPYQVLNSWLTSINSIRNICAHHSRLWNRVIPYKPQLLSAHKHPEWHENSIDNSRLFSILTILKYLMNQIAPQSGWKYRLLDLLKSPKYDIPLFQMGFPNDWESMKLWKDLFDEDR